MSIIVKTAKQIHLLLNEKFLASAKDFDSKFDVPTLINSIKGHNSPQSEAEGLLALSNIATIFPKKVLDHVMDLFTYVGTSTTLQKDDNYTFYILKKVCEIRNSQFRITYLFNQKIFATQTIETIIPYCILGENEKNPSKESKKAFEVIYIFVNSFKKIAPHRATHLFSSLINTIGVKQSLGVTLLMLLFASATDGQTKQKAETNKRAELEAGLSIPVFCEQLVSQFNVSDVLDSFIFMLDATTKFPLDEAHFQSGKSIKQFFWWQFNNKSNNSSSLKLRLENSIELHKLVYDLVASYIGSSSFVANLASVTSAYTQAEEELENTLGNLFRLVLVHWQMTVQQKVDTFDISLSPFTSEKKKNRTTSQT